MDAMLVSRREKSQKFEMLYFQNKRCYWVETCEKIYFKVIVNLVGM